jgi:hypothetical protein
VVASPFRLQLTFRTAGLRFSLAAFVNKPALPADEVLLMAWEHAGPSLLPLLCPKCQCDVAKLSVNSYTVVTVICVECSHTWSVELAALPARVQRQLPAVPRRSEIA